MLLDPAFFTKHLLAGRVFSAADADQDDFVTGQTSFANTSPTFLLNVPTGKLAMPLYVRLHEVGSVAGGNITVTIEYDNIAAYASGGTAETILSCRSDTPVTAECALYSNPTATAGYGINVFHDLLMQDVALVATDVGAFGINWSPDPGLLLVGPASLKVFTWAGTTGPTWAWSVAWLELPAGSV